MSGAAQRPDKEVKKMVKKLNRFTLNAKKWRNENGYITPEWEMYKTNMISTFFIVMLILTTLSFVAGVVWMKMRMP